MILYSGTSIYKPLSNEGLNVMSNFFTPVMVKYVKKNLDITKPRYNEQILSVPWSFVKSRFHCTYHSKSVGLVPFLVGQPVHATTTLCGIRSKFS